MRGNPASQTLNVNARGMRGNPASQTPNVNAQRKT
jgi:hypothetical protein